MSWECLKVTAPNGTTIREVLHPAREEGDLKMGYSLAHAIFKVGKSTRPHKLKTSSEVYYILQGKGLIQLKDESAIVRPGQLVYVPPNARQIRE